jgi:hypothetical protein
LIRSSQEHETIIQYFQSVTLLRMVLNLEITSFCRAHLLELEINTRCLACDSFTGAASSRLVSLHTVVQIRKHYPSGRLYTLVLKTVKRNLLQSPLPSGEKSFAENSQAPQPYSTPSHPATRFDNNRCSREDIQRMLSCWVERPDSLIRTRPIWRWAAYYDQRACALSPWGSSRF